MIKIMGLRYTTSWLRISKPKLRLGRAKRMINQNQYISMAEAKEKISNTISILDQDVKQWQQLKNMIPPARSKGRGIQKEEIMGEIDHFFNASKKLRGQLVELLQLVSTVSEN